MQCPTCHVEFKSYTAVSLHFRNKHGTSLEFKETMRLKYIDEHHGGVEPKCKCGCGKTPKYYDYDRGYVEYVRGHHSRVKNNWGHNKEAQLKSQDVRRDMHKRGEHAVWNRGETKETNEDVASYGAKGSKTIKEQPELLKRRSEDMKHAWNSGLITPLTGSAHSQWKGGSSALQPLARSRLHKSWTYPKLKASNFTCQKCGAKGPGLEVHHDGERFAEILQKAIAIFGEVVDDNFEQKASISEWVADYHEENDVSGIVLCSKCHDDEHVVSH